MANGPQQDSQDAGKRKAERCRRSYHQGVQEYKRTINLEQHDSEFIRGEDNQLDLNDPRVRVVQSSGQHTASLIKSPCKECYKNIVSLYQEELKDLKRQSTFICKHGVRLTALSNRYKMAKKEPTVPRPGIERLSLVSKINAKLCKGTDKRKLCHEDFSLCHVQGKKRHIKEQQKKANRMSQTVGARATWKGRIMDSTGSMKSAISTLFPTAVVTEGSSIGSSASKQNGASKHQV